MNLIRKFFFCRPMRRFGRSQRGVAAIELALTLPIWVTLILGAAEGSYYMLINEKTDRIAYSISDITSQYADPLAKATLNDIVLAAGQLMQPYAFGNNGYIIVSSVSQTSGTATVINWQYTSGNNAIATSKIGTTGGAATLPNGLTLNTGDNVIITEVYYSFTPLFTGDTLFPASNLYRVAIYKPRLGPLTTTPS